jgi:drug/metabolite transporter (DMT)-like permease
MNQALAFGLASALAYGASDLAARFAGRRAGTLRTLLHGHAVAVIVLGLFLWRQALPHAGADIWALALVGNLLSLAGTACLYRALANGALGVVCPIVATYGAITALLSAVSGEALSRLAWLGLALTACGGALSARPGGDAAATRGGVGLAFAAAILYGVSFFVLGRSVLPTLGVLATTTLYYGTGLLTMLIACLASRSALRLPQGAALPVFTAAGLACLGTLALACGQRTGHVGLVTVLSALAAGVTVVLARLFLHEPVSRASWSGIGLVLLGLGLLRAG